jgi:hypothetical protein
MKALIIFVLLSSVCFAQVPPVSKLLTAGGFLDVCGLSEMQLSKEQVATMKSNASQGMAAFNKAMDDRLAQEAMCIGYVAGLTDGWQEGHEHGVVAAQFPDGWPQDEEKAFSALPTKTLQAANSAMKVDVPCIPDYVTIGQERDIIVKYIQEQQKTNPLIGLAMTRHVMSLAFRQSFPCTLHPK